MAGKRQHSEFIYNMKILIDNNELNQMQNELDLIVYAELDDRQVVVEYLIEYAQQLTSKNHFVDYLSSLKFSFEAQLNEFNRPQPETNRLHKRARTVQVQQPSASAQQEFSLKSVKDAINGCHIKELIELLPTNQPLFTLENGTASEHLDGLIEMASRKMNQKIHDHLMTLKATLSIMNENESSVRVRPRRSQVPTVFFSSAPSASAAASSKTVLSSRKDRYTINFSADSEPSNIAECARRNKALAQSYNEEDFSSVLRQGLALLQALKGIQPLPKEEHKWRYLISSVSSMIASAIITSEYQNLANLELSVTITHEDLVALGLSQSALNDISLNFSNLLELFESKSNLKIAFAFALISNGCSERLPILKNDRLYQPIIKQDSVAKLKVFILSTLIAYYDSVISEYKSKDEINSWKKMTQVLFQLTQLHFDLRSSATDVKDNQTINTASADAYQTLTGYFEYSIKIADSFTENLLDPEGLDYLEQAYSVIENFTRFKESQDPCVKLLTNETLLSLLDRASACLLDYRNFPGENRKHSSLKLLNEELGSKIKALSESKVSTSNRGFFKALEQVDVALALVDFSEEAVQFKNNS